MELVPNNIPDILNNYESAKLNYSEGSSDLQSILGFFEVEGLTTYLKNANEILLNIYNYTSDYVTISTGHDTVKYKIAYLINETMKAEEKAGRNADMLSAIFLQMISGNQKLKEYIEQHPDLSEDEFDNINIKYYKDWKNSYDKIKEKMGQAFDTLHLNERKSVKIDAKTLQAALNDIYGDNELAKEYINNLFLLDDDESSIGLKGLASLMGIFATLSFMSVSGESIGNIATAAVGGGGSDYVFNMTDTALWAANTPISQFTQAWLGETLAAGVGAGVIASTIVSLAIATQDGKFDSEKFIIESIPAGTGSAVSAAIYSIGGTIGSGIAGAGIGTIVTIVLGEVIDQYFNPGGIPRDYEKWTEEDQAKIIEEKLGIDINFVDLIEKSIKSDIFDDKQKDEILDSYINGNFGGDVSNAVEAVRQYYLNYDTIQSCKNEEEFDSNVGFILTNIGIRRYNSETGEKNEQYTEIYNYMLELNNNLEGGNNE